LARPNELLEGTLVCCAVEGIKSRLLAGFIHKFEELCAQIIEILPLQWHPSQYEIVSEPHFLLHVLAHPYRLCHYKGRLC